MLARIEAHRERMRSRLPTCAMVYTYAFFACVMLYSHYS